MDEIIRLSTRLDVAVYLDIPLRKLTYILYYKKIESFYNVFDIPKKNGELRTICAPVKDLKELQQRLASKLNAIREREREKYPILKKVSYGFENERCIMQNAAVHRNKRYVYSIDLKDFFGSFHFGRVRGFFFHCDYLDVSMEVATVLAQLCCYNGKLPQGAPTSPVITNCICLTMDKSIARLASKYHLYYTRYADDLTFSTNDIKFLDWKAEFTQKLEDIILKSGFSINQDKTRLALRDSRQMVTGLIVNKRISISRDYYKKTRAMLDHYMKNGEFFIDDKEATLQQLEGRIAFVAQVEKYNKIIEYQRLVSTNSCNQELKPDRFFKKLNAREKTVQTFLFYKYFFGRENPLIVTEGPTDIIHLKCALLKYKDSYPKLVHADAVGKIRFRVAFLNRWRSKGAPCYCIGTSTIRQMETSLLEQYFGLVPHGADTMSMFYSNFYGTDKLYDSLIRKRCNYGEPVIFVYDNEKKSERPIHKLMKVLPKELSKRLETNNAVKVNNNLFVLSVPLADDKDECEIEDLYDEEVLNRRLDGKKFSRDSDYNINEYYGKEIFAKRIVAADYQNISFERFRPLLENINSIVTRHEVDII